jgi:hypothetical protein
MMREFDSNERVAPEAKNPQAHQAAADAIDRIIKGKNSVRHA